MTVRSQQHGGPIRRCVAVVVLSLSMSAFAVDGGGRRLLEQTGVKGGLVVHVNGGDGRLAGELCVSDAYRVHGLDADGNKIAAGRKRLRDAVAYGRVTLEPWHDGVLPYADNLVNLVVVSDGVVNVEDAELLRVLAPGGKAVKLTADGRQATGDVLTKPWPKAMGEWTHYQFDARGNSVGTDRLVGLPRHFQWKGGPLWSTAHESMSSLSAMVSAKGRIFYTIDEGPRASSVPPADWQLVARDAFNGVILWKRPLQRWLTRFWPWKSGPAQMPRKLLAVGDAVYAPLDINGPVVRLDAATGTILRTYEGTAAAEEIVLADGILLVMTTPDPPDQDAIAKERQRTRHFNYDGKIRVLLNHDVDRKVMAIHADTGDILWQRNGPRVLPLTLASDGVTVAYHDGKRIVGLDLRTGGEQWVSGPIDVRLRLPSEDAPTLVIYRDVVLFAAHGKLTALSKTDGKTLWTSGWTQADYRGPVSVMVLGGKARSTIWTRRVGNRSSTGISTCRAHCRTSCRVTARRSSCVTAGSARPDWNRWRRRRTSSRPRVSWTTRGGIGRTGCTGPTRVRATAPGGRPATSSRPGAFWSPGGTSSMATAAATTPA